MRYYGEDYSQELERTISAVRDSVEARNYAMPIDNAPIRSDHYGIKYQGVNASRQAVLHVLKIKNKLDMLQEVLDTFYSDVDETGSNIIEMADIIKGIIQESNDSLARMSRMLRGVGEYMGQTITPESLHSVGIKVDYKSRYKDFWIMVLDTDLVAGNVREDLVDTYLERLESQKDISLSSDDTKRLQGLLDHYSKVRFGETNDIRDVDPLIIDHCVKIYEYMNPEDVKIIDHLFKEPLKENNKTIDLNIRNIKYGLYTADPEIRAIILHYLPDIKLNDYKGEQYTDYVPAKNEININLKASYDNRFDSYGCESDPFAGFFHEAGHGIDELSAPEDKYRASGIEQTIYKDSCTRFYDVLTNSGITLSEEQKYKVIDFAISNKNINVILPEDKGIDKYLPKKWDDGSKAAYNYLRDYYGRVDLVMDETSYTLEKTLSNSDEIKGDKEYELTSDIVGAATNNKLAAFPYAHGASFMRGTGFISSSMEGLKEQLITDSYWCGEYGQKSKTIEREFFAHYFNEKALGFDSTPSLRNFPETCAQVDRIIEGIYDEISSQ